MHRIGLGSGACNRKIKIKVGLESLFFCHNEKLSKADMVS